MDTLLSQFVPATTASKRQQITTYLRNLVISGELPPGTRLPPTQLLAEQWNAPVATVQMALTPLVKEGLLLRRPRLGTIVRERRHQLKRVALYLTSHLGMEGSAGYGRALVVALREGLSARGIETMFLVDPRPSEIRNQAWDELITLTESRRLQGLIAPVVDELRLAWLTKLPVPAAFGGSSRLPNVVCMDHSQFADAGLRELLARGCRSAGLISVVPRRHNTESAAPHLYDLLYRQFVRTAAETGMEIRDDWVFAPDADTYVSENDAQQFGYDAIRSLWGKQERPDGLLVYTDVAARGVILGLLEMQVRVPEALKLVLHRNAEVGLLCPFDTGFLDTHVKTVAEKLIDIVVRQADGQTVNSFLLPFALTGSLSDEGAVPAVLESERLDEPCAARVAAKRRMPLAPERTPWVS